MLVFFIHGVNTQNCRYADTLIRNIKKNVKTPANFYSSFWGNLFNDKKHQLIGYLEKDFSRVCENHKEYKGYYNDIYRYKKRRNDLVSNFLGDFLIYQNPERGKEIRQVIFEQFNQFLYNHPDQTQIHFIAHSLGSFILWDLLFSDALPSNDPAFIFREKLNDINLESISTLGCPLLFLKQMLDIDFSVVDHIFDKKYPKDPITSHSHQLRWVNIIHSSDLIAYPLKAAIEGEISPELLFFDQYVWQDANGTELTLRNLGQSDLAMVVAAEDAHSSYFYDNLDGAITARIIGHNLLGATRELEQRCVSAR
ncbi:hypothetical protein [Calothrix sp. PCC 6303]|uniref:hypothetical protein n=1 Tax=Calothrix sp. PCC 6303 TaxID=1170562 RepID=UPI0002A00430|nr:hypothetical protein [Calothrix sp. PCC 6303]AFY99480.1 hypothetical protein Cal6303_0403 [Calothrix sp. PCC 6303]